MKTALIAMSGGVDSSVAAYLMIEKGYTCEGVTMRLYHNEELTCNFKTCCSDQDVADARRVAARLGMPFSVLDYKEDFDEKIISKFVRTYEHGGTPNPCIDCNRFMKFDKLMQEALSRGRDKVVTGHYVRTGFDETAGRYILKKGVDAGKDQSYVLYQLTQEQLEHTMFPLGELEKSEVRDIAAKQDFVNATKHESQDICFVPDGDYASFIERYTGRKYAEGDFVDTEGNVLGKHKGVIRYTIGQRKGLGIASEYPYYVVRLDVEGNRVILAHDARDIKGEAESILGKHFENSDTVCGLYSDTLTATDINLISVPEIKGEYKCKAKVRYRHKEQPCTVIQTDKDMIKVIFDEPQRAITKGQAVVLYDGDIVIGGGTIN